MAEDDMTGDIITSLPTVTGPARLPSPLEQLASIPEEEIWLQKQKSARTRRAYRLDVQHFMRTLGITSPEELRQADDKAVIAWECYMRESEHAAASTIRRRLAALSSLYKHLVRHDHAARNPVGEVERPAINRDEGSTLAFAKAQARKLLDAPAEDTVPGLRDRAILSVGLQVGLRRAEIAALTVGDLHQNRGYDSLRVSRKGGRRDALAINPQTAARLRAYLEASGHTADIDGPLFRPLKHNGKRQEERRPMDPDAIDRVVRKYAGELGLIAATRRTRCAPPSSPPRSRTAPSWRTCRRPRGIGTRAQRSFMTGAGTIRKRQQVSSLRTDRPPCTQQARESSYSVLELRHPLTFPLPGR
jgi:integrase/recombinase XerD